MIAEVEGSVLTEEMRVDFEGIVLAEKTQEPTLCRPSF